MTSDLFSQIFKTSKTLIGCIHVGALPGTPGYLNNWKKVLSKSVEEAKILADAGFDGLIIENMHDTPYLKRKIGPEITAAMTAIGVGVKQAVDLPVGVQILAGANKAALGCAKAAGLDFIRAEGFVYGHLADEGLFESDAGEILRFRKMIDAGEVAIFTDIQKKHSSHAISADISIADWAKAADFFRSDGLVVTGKYTGEPVDFEDIQKVRTRSTLPVILGSGINLDNINHYLEVADAVIVGSWYKENGYWANEIDVSRAKALAAQVRR